MEEQRAFEIARRHFPGGEPIVTVRRAAKVVLAAVREAVLADAQVAALRAAARHGVAIGDRSHAAAWRRVLELLDAS